MGLTAFAGKVSETRARIVASNFWRIETGSVPQLKNITAQAGLTEVYLFEVGSSNGYIVISTDDVAYPVLAYSLKNGFPTDNIAPAVMYMLRNYEHHIAFARDLGEGAMPEVEKEWRALESGMAMEVKSRTSVSPLMTSIWSQNAPYNNMCPQAEGQSRCVTGCVATAMAQVMRYWKYPEHGVGQHSYTYNDRPVAVTHMVGDSNAVWLYDTLTADFENTYYAWDDMPDNATASSTDTEKEAVATLLLHCGVAVDMVYTPTGSGAFMTRQEVLNFDPVNYSTEIAAEVVIPQYFGYSENTAGYFKNDYTTLEWTSLLKNEISNGRPIIFAGNDPGSDYGHAFVLDGYNPYLYFHCNFGWGGQFDGNFRVDEIAPARSGHAFTDKQCGIFYMYPPGQGFYGVQVMCNGAGGTVFDCETAVCDSSVSVSLDEGSLQLKIVADEGYTISKILADKDTIYVNNAPFGQHDITCSAGDEPRTVVCDFSNRKRDVTLKAFFASGSMSISTSAIATEKKYNVFANGKNIEIRGSGIEKVEVYDAIGRHITTFDGQYSDSASIAINRRGVYVVRIGNNPYKVVIN